MFYELSLIKFTGGPRSGEYGLLVDGPNVMEVHALQFQIGSGTGGFFVPAHEKSLLMEWNPYSFQSNDPADYIGDERVTFQWLGENKFDLVVKTLPISSVDIAIPDGVRPPLGWAEPIGNPHTAPSVECVKEKPTGSGWGSVADDFEHGLLRDEDEQDFDREYMPENESCEKSDGEPMSNENNNPSQ
jgi:hypothetical protein